MNPEYTEYKIIEVKKNGNSSNIIRVKCKNKIFPGQYFIGWLAGYGEFTLPVCLYEKDNLEFSVSKTIEVQDKAHHLKSKDLIYLRGPYGKGFPMNNLNQKDLVLIGQNNIFSPIFSVLNYTLQNRKDFKKIKVMMLQNKDNKDFVEILERTDDKNEIEVLNFESYEKILDSLYDIDEIKNKDFLLSLENNELKEIVSFLKKKNISEKQIYFYIPRKISCGIGICGTCAVYGVHACIEGPVFRADRFERYFA